MDASDIIKRNKDKTVYSNISAYLSTSQTGSTPGVGGLKSNTAYSFSNYEIRQDYFEGRYNLHLASSINVSCATLSYQ